MKKIWNAFKVTAKHSLILLQWIGKLLHTVWFAEGHFHKHRIALKWVYIGVGSVVACCILVGVIEVWHASLALLIEWGFHQMFHAAEEKE